MFDKFLNKYVIDTNALTDSRDKVPSNIDASDGAGEFLKKYQGVSFGGGLYRVIPLADVVKWNEIVIEIFSQFKDKIECFGIDWLGRVFAWNHDIKKVVSLDPGFGEASIIPCSLSELHEIEFVEYSNDSLSSDFYDDYRNLYGGLSKLTNCLGYKISPFLGGGDTVENLEEFDPEVYWALSTEIYKKVKNM